MISSQYKNLLVWVGLGWVKKQVFGDRIPIGKLYAIYYIYFLDKHDDTVAHCITCTDTAQVLNW
jgi:hypothetical protein